MEKPTQKEEGSLFKDNEPSSLELNLASA